MPPSLRTLSFTPLSTLTHSPSRPLPTLTYPSSRPLSALTHPSSRPLPTIPTCPSPTCPCSPTPSFPSTHPIDHASPLNGVVPTYTSHLLVCTGGSDWASRIEDENGGNNASAWLKNLYGPRGTLSEPGTNISVLNASFGAQDQGAAAPAVYMLPEFRFVPSFPFSSPPRLGAAAAAATIPESSPVEDIMVLICGHANRDLRCGVMGPLLQREFEEKLAAAGVEIRSTSPAHPPRPHTPSARIGQISHIGGHKFAGNIIVYVPPTMMAITTATPQAKHPLAGMGIWYGRVEPRHVEGIVAETILAGTVIQDLLRGGIDRDRRMLRP